jgi:hypothetical protein
MSSEVVELVVQQEPVEREPDTPLPTEYWAFPINGQNYAWGSVTGPWLEGNFDHNSRFNQYNRVPKAPHVNWMWRNAFGGIEGGTFGATSYATGRSYESKNTPNILINNIWYHYGPVGDRVNHDDNLLNAIDINTGEAIWTKELKSEEGVGVGRVPLRGQIFKVSTANQDGVHAYLWSMSGSRWRMYCAYTGNHIMDWENVTSGRGGSTITQEPGTGNFLVYTLDTVDGWLACWNFTKACIGEGTRDGVAQWQSQLEKEQYGFAGCMWRPRQSALRDWMRGIEWNVSIPVESEWMAPGRSAQLSWGKVNREATVMVAISWWNDPVLVPKSIMQIYGYSLDPANP